MARHVDPEVVAYREEYIRQHYETKTYEQIAKALRISEGHARNLASRLGLRRYSAWSTEEKEFMSSHTLDEIIEKYGDKYPADFLYRKYYNFKWKKKNAALKKNRNPQILEQHLGKEIISKLKSR